MAKVGWAASAGSAAVTPWGRDSPGEQDNGTAGDVLALECNRYSLDPTETNRSHRVQGGRGKAPQMSSFDLR